MKLFVSEPSGLQQLVNPLQLNRPVLCLTWNQELHLAKAFMDREWWNRNSTTDSREGPAMVRGKPGDSLMTDVSGTEAAGVWAGPGTTSQGV